MHGIPPKWGDSPKLKSCFSGDVETDRPKNFARPAEVEQSIPQRFAEIVARHANRTAISSGSTEWSYAELDQRSNALALQILERSDANSEPVALLMDHGAGLIAAILAVLKTGKIYVALDPNDSIERLAAMLSDSGARLLIADQTNAAPANSLATGQLSILPFDDDFSTSWTCTNFSAVSPEAGAWLMYTSGSTGTPKGVWENHRGVMHHANVYRELIQLAPDDRLSLLTSCSFAASTTPLFAALLNGATLCPFHVRSRGVERLAIWLRERGVTIYDSVPTIFRHLARVTGDNGIFGGLRLVRLAGEPVLGHDVEVFRQRFPGHCRLMNVLASTETGFISASIIEKDTVLPEGRVSVGCAVGDVEISLVDDQGQKVENGCDGRIAVRSAYLRQGYWRRPNETLEKFRIDPRAPHTRIFITSDLGRWDEEGNLIHLGRRDNQLKSGGLWLNPAEIESVLMRVPGVREAAVVAVDHSEGMKKLTVFLSWKRAAWPEQSLRLELQKQLPPHSVPSRFFTLKELPLLPSGKIDRVTLVRRGTELRRSRSSAADPDDMLELQLVRIWEKVLAVEAVATTDDFFTLGGDSLAAATMLAAVEKFCGVNLPAASLLEASTIKNLAGLIRSGGLGQTGLRLVGLRLGGSRPPLYYVPGAGGDALESRMLARYLTNEQPVFAFQPRHFNGRSPYPRSVEEMAKSYIETMRVHQPRGPYNVCGASFGGVVAFEMARQLEGGGEQVAFLGLFDSYGGGYPKRRKRLTPRKRLKQALLRFLPLAWYTISLGSLKSGLKEQMKRWFVRRMIMLDGWLRFRVLRCPSKLRVFYVQEICFAAHRRYKLQPFSGKIDLFRAEHQPPSDLFEEDPLLGWGGMAAGGIEVHQLPGNHTMYLQEPMIAAVVAAQLESCLEKKRTRIDSSITS
jgi:amino acid adenylation domain-containing protein